MGSACSTHRKYNNLVHIFIGKPERKTPFVRPTCRWENNIKMHLKETGCEVVYMIHTSHDRVHCQVLSNLWIT